MSNDVLITPASRKIEFKDSSANVDAKIETDASGNLVITNTGGDISIGDTTSDIFVGDGTNNIDIVFEQDGEIRGTTGVTVTLGQSDSNIRMATDLNLNSNDITNVGDLTITGNLTVSGTTTTLETATLNVEDKNITLNYGSGDTSGSANGAGITIQDGVNSTTDATILWDAGNDEFDISHPVKVAGSIGVTNIVTNKVVKYNGTILDDSNITDTGSLITLGSNTTVSGVLQAGAGSNHISTSAAPFRWQRSSSGQTGQDDNVSVYVDDSNIYFTHNNDDDGDASGFNFRYTTGGVATNLLNFNSSTMTYKGQTVFHDGYHPNADTWTTARTITLGGDLTGNVSINGSANVTLTAAVVDDSHNHVISNVDGLQSALDAKLASSSYTASDVLTKIKTVDSSGSGLDADLLDGQHGSYYQPADTTILRHRGTVDVTSATGGSNTNPFDDAHTETKVAEYGTRLISYTGASATMLTINTSGSASVFQIGAHYNGNDFYMRTRTDGGTNWQTWKKLWHTGNDASGSGLDADLLDGQHGSYYATASGLTSTTTTANAALPKAGGTMTGTITSRDILVGADYHLQRSNHHSGHLEGSYNNVGANGPKSNPIYTIGSSYNPSDAAFGNMYGIGYCSTAHTGINFTGQSNWGMYVAADGDARVWLDGSAGVVSSTGQHYVGSNVVWNAGNDGSGSGLDADTVDGKHKDYLMHYKGIVAGNWDTIFSQTDGHMGVYEVQNITSGSHSNYPTGAYTYGGVLSWQLDNSTFKMYAPHTGGLYIQNGWNNDEYSGWRKVWDSGNDGSSSGLDADLLDGQHGSYYLDYNNFSNTPTIPTNNNQLTNGAGYVTASTTSLSNYMRLNAVADVTNYSHVHTFYTNGNMASTSGSQSSLQCYNGTVGNDAFMTFHVGSDFACYFGLDGGTNKLSVGGWSMGANSYEIYHAGNKPSLATLGFTGDSNANYITNNNQLTNGAGYITDGNTNWNNTYGFITNTSGTAKGANQSYVASSTSTSNRGNYGAGVWAYTGYSTGSNRPFTYDATLQVMPTSALGFELSTDWHSSSGQLKLRSLRDCCQGWSDYTTIWTSASDGSGSGLDADLLDGQHGSYYAPTASPTFTGTLTNAGTLTTAANQHTMNTPHGYIQIGPMNTSWAHIYTDRSNFYFNKQLYVLGDKVWNAGNDGSGSGLDADTVDGINGASLLRSDANDTYTGTLSVAGTIQDSGDSRQIRLMHGTTSSQPAIGVGEQGLYGMKMRWDSGSRIEFDGFWSTSVTGSRNRDLGSINVNTAVWELPTGVTINGSTAWHAGNDGSGSGLDADTLDGYNAEEGAVNNSIVKRDGTASIKAFGLSLLRQSTARTGITWYNESYYNWQDYMASAGVTGCGPNGNLTAPTGLAGVTSWALRSRMEGVSTYGWNWETGSGGGGGATATSKMSLNATTGNLQIAGSFTAGADVIAYSDEKLKDDVQVIENAVEKVKQVRGVTFTRNDLEDQERHAGVIAQEVEKVLPEVVGYDEDRDTKTVAYGNMVGLLIEAIKEQQETIEKLTSRINDIEKGE